MTYNNPVTFYDNDGRKPIEQHFTTLYGFKNPETREKQAMSVDPITEHSYWPIKEVFGFKEKEKKKEVDVWVRESEEINIRVISGPELASTWVIWAHGVFVERMKPIILKPDTPSITILGKHRETLLANAGGFRKPYAKISYEGIELSSEQAAETYFTESYPEITGTATERAFQDLIFAKLETAPINLYTKHIFETLASHVHETRVTGDPVDFVGHVQNVSTNFL